jgi:PAS domain S-box-containing protein
VDYIIATHKQIEQTVRYLTVIAEQTREAVIVADFSGDIQFVNTAWATMHGYENSQELIGKQINVFHTKEQMKTDVTPFIEEVKHRGRLAGPVEHVRRNGIPFPTEMLMVVFNDDAGRAMGLVGFATDITKQERIEEELRRYRRQMEELIEQQTEALEAANSRLQSQVTKHEQAGQKLKQQTAELSAANKQLREQICESERVKDKLEQHRDKLEQHLKQQSDELTTVDAQLQDEIAKRKKEEEYFKQQTNAIKAAGEQLRTQIDELSARGPIGKPDMMKTTDSIKAAESLTYDEKAMLENVFRQNIVLQKPKLDSAARKDL